VGFLEKVPQLDDVIARLECAERLEELQTAIEWLRDHYAVDDMVYHWVSSNGTQ
jgi:hypothetical protein